MCVISCLARFLSRNLDKNLNRDYRRTIGAEGMVTKRLQLGERHDQTTRVGGASDSRGGLRHQQLGQVARSRGMKRPVGEGEDLKIDTLLDRQPVKVRQKSGVMWPLRRSRTD